MLKGTALGKGVLVLDSLRRQVSYRLSRFRSDDLRSSLSDNRSYPDFCARAACDDDLFRVFRSAPGYSEILEHVPWKLGKKYLDAVVDRPALRIQVRNICESDNTGGPRKYEYPGLGSASPTTLRYFKVAADLEQLFGTLDDLRIAEIGVGYGGQCRVVCTLHNPRDYALFDLTQVLSLTERFLSETVPSAQTSFYSADEIPELQTDLVISNYAFSELRREVQETYMNRVVGSAQRGYMTFNQITPKSFRSMSIKDFADRVGGRILPERPKSYPGNKIVVWGI